MTTDGLIGIDSDFAKEIGFTGDRFRGWGWLTGDTFIISCIAAITPGRGHFRSLLTRLLEAGYRVQVPTPSARMRSILLKHGFSQRWEDTEMGACEIFEKKPR